MNTPNPTYVGKHRPDGKAGRLMAESLIWRERHLGPRNPEPLLAELPDRDGTTPMDFTQR